jgi:hypothetical protein
MKRTIATLFVGFLMWGFVASDALATKPSAAAAEANQAATAQRNKQEQAAQTAHEQAVNDAQTAMNDAQATLDEVALRAQNAFEASPDYVAANNELTTDQKAYDTASAAVLKTVNNSPAYVAAKAESDKSQAQLADLKANSGSSDADVTAQASEAMQAGSAAHKIESDALAADPSTAAAMEKLTASQKSMNELKQKFHDEMIKSSDYVAAKSVVTAADKRLIDVERARPGYVPAIITAKGKIAAVSTDSFTISVAGAKNAHHNVTVNYATSTTITGAADKTIDKSLIGKIATVVGKQASNTITASTIIITASTTAPRPK